MSAFSYTTATGLSAMTGGAVSHDKITRFLSEKELDSCALWRLVKPVALSLEGKKRGEYEQVGSLKLEPGMVREVYVEQVEFPLLLVKRVFKNEDGTEGVLYLVSSDVTLDYERLTTIYWDCPFRTDTRK